MDGTRVSHYEIVRLLGRGGMGEVWEAVDLDLDRRPVAIKFLSPELARDPESLARFEREAASAARLKHPHIATVHAFDRAGQRPFMDMELLTGGSLRDRMAGPLPVAPALAIARDVAAALAHAHRRGVIHRDIKPENLMFDEEGAVKVADFGLARALQASKLTQTGTTLGTAAYMAPESVRGQGGAPADVFALGTVLYEMLAGALPFPGDQPLAQMYAIANQPHPPLAERRPDAPPAALALVDRMLEKDPAARISAADAAAQLAALTGVRPEPVTAGHETAAAGTAPRPRRRPAVAAAVLGLIGAATLSVMLLVVWPAVAERARRDAILLNNRGIEALAADSLDAAAAWFERAVERDGAFARARINLAATLRRRGERDRAAAVLAPVLDRARDSTLRAGAYSVMADIELDAANHEAAVAHLRRAASLAPASEVYVNNLGYALLRTGRPTEAWAVLEPALAQFPDRPELLKNGGLALLGLGRAAEALPLLDRAIRLDPDYAAAWGARARVEARRGARERALEDWRMFAGLERDPAALAAVREELERDGLEPPPVREGIPDRAEMTRIMRAAMGRLGSLGLLDSAGMPRGPRPR